jgi:hypothetical protein
MELGTSVFLSAIFLGTVALFIATKDRWNWRRIFLWPVAAVLGLSIAGGTAVYIYDQYQSRPIPVPVPVPVPQTSLWDITLGTSPAQIKFEKGQPSEIKGNEWLYLLGREAGDGGYVIGFKDWKVRLIIYYGTRSSAPTIAGVSPYSSLSEIENKLGAPSFVSRSKDELQRWYSFDKFNVGVLFEKGEVVALGIFDPEAGPIRFVDEAP